MWTCAGLLVVVACASAVTRDQFYPHGPGIDQTLPRGSEIRTPEATLKVPIKFYGEIYDSIFVNNFGVLTFRADISSYLNIEFPLPYPSIAAFYTNIDTTYEGAVYYRETNERHVLSKAEESVQNNFQEYYDFQPTSVFIATWLDVTYTSNDSSSTPKNTFQIAVISNGAESFVEFLYPERDIQWYQKEPKVMSLPDAKAQAGFISEDGRIYTLRGSGSHQIRNIVAWTNTHDPGRYVFRIGDIPLEGNVATPDQYNRSEIETEEESKTCAQSGPSVCHVQARCTDYPAGICCQCRDGYYGNGKSCIKDDIPLRVHGKINGVLNEVSLNDVDIQAYVVVGEGRAYTALSIVPDGLGSSLQLLNVLGGVVGWLFAKPAGSAKNGYQLTGSSFNHTADVWFPSHRSRVTINQEYLGHDVFDQITLETDIRGSIPFLQTGTKLEIADYDEQYTLVEPGLVKSEASRTFINKVTGEKIEQRVSQTFSFGSCRFAPLSPEDTAPFTLKISKNYLGYESRENIVRYGMTNKIFPLGQEDPCIQGRSSCGPHSTCVAQGDSYTCVCQSGFTSIYQDDVQVCIDLDECEAGTHNCDANADCYNHAGGFQCRCRGGFTGNGISCSPISPCLSKRCDVNAQCMENSERQATCVCNSGFYGDGQVCYVEPSRGDPLVPPQAPVESDYNDTFVLPSCNDFGCTCPPEYSDYRDRNSNQLCRRNDYQISPQEQYPDSSYQQSTEPPQRPTEQYHTPQTDRPYQPTAVPSYPPPDSSYPRPWDGEDQSGQGYPQQTGYDQSSYQYPDTDTSQQSPDSDYPPPDQAPSEGTDEQRPGNGYEEPSGNGYQEPDLPSYQEPSGNGYQEPVYQSPTERSYQEQPSGNYDPYGSDYPQPQGSAYPQPQGSGYPQPQGSGYPQSQGSSSPQPQGSGYPQPQGSGYPQPQGSGYSQPQGSGYPQPQHSGYPQPQGSGYQQPQGTGYPQAQGNYEPSWSNGYPYDQRPHTAYEQPPPANSYQPSYAETTTESEYRQPTEDALIRCEEDLDCPPNAVCVADGSGDEERRHCVCPEGYEGDAYECIERSGPSCQCGLSAHCVSIRAGEHICVCDPGYHGDGYHCRPNFMCTNNSDCEYNAECRPDPKTNEYVCQCMKGFIKDQNDACIPDAQLCNGASCVEHASCLYDAELDLNFCHCDDGYTGDAISHCVIPGHSCDVANDCSIDADCTLVDSAYQCICRDGYNGDGYNCMPEPTCRFNADMCDIHASCLKRNDVYVCECNAGYNGNGSQCVLNPRPAGNFLVASDGASVYRVPFVVTPRDFARPFNSGISQIAVGIDVDCEVGTIYWGDVVSYAIKSSRYDGSGPEIFLGDGVKSPEGIAVDWVARNIFWTDSKKLTIEVANMDTRARKVLFSIDRISNPRGIAVHPRRGKIFWSDWNRKDPKIEWASMDGSQRGIFLDKTDVALPNSLAIDWDRERLCYADAGLFCIKCVSLDTMEKETIATNCSYPFGLAIHGDKFYWSDWRTVRIESIDVGTQIRSHVPISPASRRLYGVAVAPDQCPPVAGVCQYRNGGCGAGQLCLPDGNNGRSCVDPDTTYRRR